jgi:hypothetical protein
MRDGLVLMGDEFWPRLDDVKEFCSVLRTPIELSEFEAPTLDRNGLRPQRKAADGEAAERPKRNIY